MKKKTGTTTKKKGSRAGNGKRSTATGATGEPPEAEWELRLYVAGQSEKSLTALSNLRRLCDEHLAGKYRIEVIDLMKQPQLAAGDQILAIPTLVRKLPSPIRKIVGDLSSTERALVGLDIRATS